MTQVRTSRRIVFQGLGGLGVALALAGCGGDDAEPADPSSSSDPSSDAAPSDPPSSEAPSSSAAPPEEPSTPEEPTSSAAPAGDALATTGEVPVGGGVVLPDENLVLVQPTAGEFKAYTRSCTHQGTPVEVDGSELMCPTHGSRFAAADGAVLVGPASAPLLEVAITVTGDRITLA